MRHRFALMLVLCLAAIAVLAVGASAAAAGTDGLPQVGTPDMARVLVFTGEWWSGGNGWGTGTWHAPGTPIPADDAVVICDDIWDADRSLVERIPEVWQASLTVKNGDGDVVMRVAEEQALQYMGPVTWNPVEEVYFRPWHVPLGQLPAGTYRVTFIDQLTTTIVGWYQNEDGSWYSIVYKPFRWNIRSSFTVQ